MTVLFTLVLHCVSTNASPWSRNVRGEMRREMSRRPSSIFRPVHRISAATEEHSESSYSPRRRFRPLKHLRPLQNLHKRMPAGVLTGAAVALASTFSVASGADVLVQEGASMTVKTAQQEIGTLIESLQAWMSVNIPRLREAAIATGAAALPLTVLLSAACFFSLSETAITTLWPWKIKEMAMNEPNDRNGALQTLRRDITRFLTTILIGGTLASVAVAAVFTELFTQLLGPVGTSVATGISTVLIVLFCEITPKAIAVQYPQAVLRAVIVPLHLIATVLYPLGKTCTGFCNALLRPFGITGAAAPAVTSMELRMVLEGAEDSGQVTDREADMVEGVLQLGDTTVESVMTPLVDVVAIDQNATLEDMVSLWKKYQYSRLPVYSNRVDNLVGVAFTKDLLNFAEKPTTVLSKAKVRHIMVQPPFFVPESMIVRKLLQEFQTRKFHMAVVVNEYGGVAGLVTLEDVLEEIVGEIFDETDIARPNEDNGIVQWEEGIWYSKGESTIDAVSEAIGAVVPKGPHETIAGYVVSRIGRIPQVGESFEVILHPLEEEDEGFQTSKGGVPTISRRYTFKVVSTNERQVIEVRIDLLPDSTTIAPFNPSSTKYKIPSSMSPTDSNLNIQMSVSPFTDTNQPSLMPTDLSGNLPSVLSPETESTEKVQQRLKKQSNEADAGATQGFSNTPSDVIVVKNMSSPDDFSINKSASSSSSTIPSSLPDRTQSTAPAPKKRSTTRSNLMKMMEKAEGSEDSQGDDNLDNSSRQTSSYGT
eukprot:CAMPEP_0167754618 /NCGR_PEP_ID=MMETSP0110_2-20121227/8369_1 /TAXON_ID=629695 /ORGANISM="Gymnochlora sp., Strain CCMP2014" /LENGTH=763 /DNA_ID=CAMNT_0007640515 /DNA_START=26 /DNA_END=2317 /DNA_ORIENTATION=+